MKQKKLILHVGFRKTATTSIQETLFRNKKLLEEQNIYYPEFVKPSFRRWKNHAHMLISLFSEQPEKLYIYIEKRGQRKAMEMIGAINTASREQLERLLARKDCTVLISGEDLSHQPRELLKKIESKIRQYDWSIEVIAAVRSPLSAFASDYSELVKNSLMPLSLYPSCTVASQCLENLRLVFDTVRMYPFSEACRHPRGPVGYFLDFLGIENTDNFEIFKENENLSNNATRLLDYIYQVEPIILNENKNPNRSLTDLKSFWKIPGPKFRLTCKEYEMIREKIEFENTWLESNLGREYCDNEFKLRLSDAHWGEESLQAVRNALPDVPDVLVPYVHRYFTEEQGIVLLSEYRPALERPEEIVRSVNEQLQARQLNKLSAVALLRSAISEDEDDRRLYDRTCELLLQVGKVREAMRLVDEGLVRFDDDLALMSRLGYAYEIAGETDRALDQWARVRRAHPSAEAGWIDGAMCSASLGFESDACELLGGYLASLEGRLSRSWWNRVLRAARLILLKQSEDRNVRVLLEALFFRPIAPDLTAHIELFWLLHELTLEIRNYRKSRKLLDPLMDIHRCSPTGCDEDYAIALEVALGIAVEHENWNCIRKFVAKISFQDFYKLFSLRCRPEVQYDFLFRKDYYHEIVAALPVTDPDNARKCLLMRYALGMDYGAAYEALTGSPLPTTRKDYSDFAFVAYAGNGKPKVAFCISGQLRGYQEAFASWKKSRLFADCEVSVFVHTWPKIGAVSLAPHKGHRMFSGNFLQAFVKQGSKIDGKFYPNLVRTVSDSRIVSAAELSEFFETSHVVVESEEFYRDYTNAEKMYYKIQACWELACTDEKNFHFVFRVRPDLTLRDDSEVDWCEIVDQSQNEKCYAGFLIFMETGLAVEDRLAFGNPAAMAVYSNTWGRTKDPNGLIRAHSNRVLRHTTVALSLVEHEVKAVPFPEGFVMGELLNTKRPSLELLRDALEKDLAPNNRRQDPMWRALKDDISREISAGSRRVRHFEEVHDIVFRQDATDP